MGASGATYPSGNTDTHRCGPLSEPRTRLKSLRTAPERKASRSAPGHRLLKSPAMTARIYLPARSATQSGQAKDRWILEYEPESPRVIEPLMGWTASSDMKSQVKLRFETKEEAIAYARRNGIPYRVEEPKSVARKIVSYSDNFQPHRVVPWSH
jgi:ETC complex I subunit conserved region